MNAMHAHNLFVFAVNDGKLYAEIAEPIIRRLAKLPNRGFDVELRAWRRLTDEAARRYTLEFGSGPVGVGAGFGRFTPATRQAAALEIRAHYESLVRDFAAEPQS